MHQYTADLANRMVRFGRNVHLVTIARYPGHRYVPAVVVHTLVDTRSSGLSPDTLQPAAIRTMAQVIQDIQPDVVHVAGPHLWNVPLLWALCQADISSPGLTKSLYRIILQHLRCPRES
jgi:hypothetical protein